MKRPPVQMRDEEAHARLDRWIAGEPAVEVPRSIPIRPELVSLNGHDSNGHDSNGHDRNGHDRNGHDSGNSRSDEHGPRLSVKASTDERVATGDQQ